MESDDETDDLPLPPSVDPRSYIFALYITPKLRQIFLLALLVGNFLSINISVIFLCLSWFIRSSVENRLHFLHEYYQPNAVPIMVGLSGLIMLSASIVGVKAAIHGRMLQDEEADFKPIADIFFTYSVVAAVACVAIFITALTCFIEIGVLSSALGDGLLEGMKKYKTDAEAKPEIDLMQMEYKCCGSKNYKDWLKIRWQGDKSRGKRGRIIQRSGKNEKFVGTDVPFSCCRWDVMRPCVDTRVEESSPSIKYSYPEDLTLYKKGCKEAISHYLGHTIFASVGLFMLFYFLHWVALTAMGRYINTSVVCQSFGDPPIGWLVPYQKPAAVIRQPQESEESD